VEFAWDWSEILLNVKSVSMYFAESALILGSTQDLTVLIDVKVQTSIKFIELSKTDLKV
jgi:hypothetical protein